ncbi:TPA: ATP-binding cassette domain-containing protein [Neisseria meningitidis]
MIKLNKVEFYGFQDTTKNVVLEFTRNNNVTIIFGENGCGKTTFLKLLNATFKRDSKILSENNIDKINIYYQVGDKTDKKISICRINMDERISKILKADKLLNKYSDRFSNDEKKKLLQAIFSQQKIENSFNEDEYDWEDFSKSELQESKSLTLGIDRGSNYSFSRTFTTLDLKNFILRHRKFRTIFEKLDINEFSEDFSLYIKNRNSLNKSLEDFDFENNHIYLPKIELNKITNLLLNKYRVAKAETTSRIQNALFKTLSNVIDDKLEGNESNGINQDSCNLEARLDARYKERIIDSLSEIADNPLKNKVIELLQKPLYLYK